MFRKIIPFLEIVTALAAACVVVFQLYRITEERKNKEELFNNTINKALDEIIATMEKNEVEYSMRSVTTSPQKFFFRKTKHNIYSQHRNQKFFEINPFDTATFSKNIIPIDDPALLQTLQNALTETSTLRLPADSAKITRLIVFDHIEQNIITFETPMEERIDRKKLELLIASILRQYGIGLKFAYEVRGENKCLLHSSNNVFDTLTSFSRRLFPSDAFSEQYMLSVSFPSQKTYIYKAIGATVFISLALLLIVLVVFFGTLREIFRQKQMSQVRSDFVSNMTHELKTPITSIMLASDMQKTLGESGSVNLVQTINTEAKKLLTLVEEVLQIAQFDRGKFKLTRIELDAHAVIRQAADSFALQAASRNAQININLDAAQSRIMADKLHFANIISNLIDNAMKYSKANPEICVKTSNDRRSLIICVSDNGIGMSDKAQKHIFEQFYREHTGNLHNIKGFGLGLSYVKNIVKRHRGKISVKSKIGEGSVFTIKLRLR